MSSLAPSISTLIDKISTNLRETELALAVIQAFPGEKQGPTGQKARSQKGSFASNVISQKGFHFGSEKLGG